jgi:hypothetical protein
MKILPVIVIILDDCHRRHVAIMAILDRHLKAVLWVLKPNGPAIIGLAVSAPGNKTLCLNITHLLLRLEV